MLSVALLSLLASAALPAHGAAASNPTAADPAVRVSLNHRTYQRGDRARVTVRVRDDGYLVVLQLSADGYVRVLFPLDPGDDNFVRGAQSYDILGRGDREAFTVEAASGTGTVYAAWSREPFRFDDFVRGDHWDYRVLWDDALPREPEAGLTNIVQRMSTAHFDYDLQSYFVQQQVAYAPMYYPVPYPAPYASCTFSTWYDPWCNAYYPYSGSGFGITIAFGSPYPRFYRPPFYRPFVYSPFFYGRHRCFDCWPTVVVINRPRYPGFYGYPVRHAPYQWKADAPGGGGVIGVQYRPRTTVASAAARPVSPLYLGSRYRVAADQPVLGTPRRAPGASGGAAVYSGASGGSPSRGGRRAMEQGGSTPRSASPRDVQRRAEPIVVTPRPSEPRTTQPRASEPSRSSQPRSSQPRETGRRAEPMVITPRPNAPRASAPRSAESRPTNQRPSDPRVVEPRRAEPRSPERNYDAAPRATPRTYEPPRTYQPPRQIETRTAPPPRVVEPRTSAPRMSAPRTSEPRTSAPRVSQPRSQPAPSQGGGEARGGRGRRG